MVVEMPIKLAEGVRVQSEVSMFEQLQLAAFLQRYWADNQVSCTITFDPVSEGPHIAQMLQYFQYQLKGVSFLPKFDYSKYPQLPYEAIGEELYEMMTKDLKPIHFGGEKGESSSTKGHNCFPDAVSFCNNDSCELH